MFKRIVAAALLGTAQMTVQADSVADNYPTQPVRFLVPYTPGGNADVIARLMAQKLSMIWDKPVVVENRPGASGTIAVNAVAKADPDGHTMVIAAAGNAVVAHKLIKNLPYDPVQDLTPVSVVATPPFVLVTAQDSRFSNVQDLIDSARKQPGRITFGSAGLGSANHLSGELMASLIDAPLMHVPYKGMGPAVNDVIGGRVDVAFAPVPLVMAQIKAGRLRALAVTSLQRSKVMPDVPTVAESGIQEFESGAWFAIMVPKRTPKPVVDKIYEGIQEVMKDANFLRTLENEGAVALGLSPEAASASLQSEMNKWGTLIDQLGLQPS